MLSSSLPTNRREEGVIGREEGRKGSERDTVVVATRTIWGPLVWPQVKGVIYISYCKATTRANAQ